MSHSPTVPCSRPRSRSAPALHPTLARCSAAPAPTERCTVCAQDPTPRRDVQAHPAEKPLLPHPSACPPSPHRLSPHDRAPCVRASLSSRPSSPASPPASPGTAHRASAPICPESARAQTRSTSSTPAPKPTTIAADLRSSLVLLQIASRQPCSRNVSRDRLDCSITYLYAPEVYTRVLWRSRPFHPVSRPAAHATIPAHT